MRPYADRHLWRTEATTIRDVWPNLESIWTENSVISPYWVAWSMTLWVEPVSQRLGIEFRKSTLQFGLGNWIVSTQRRVLDPDRWPVTWRCGMDALACVVTFGGCFSVFLLSDKVFVACHISGGSGSVHRQARWQTFPTSQWSALFRYSCMTSQNPAASPDYERTHRKVAYEISFGNLALTPKYCPEDENQSWQKFPIWSLWPN